jgi:hypothetical protein
VRHADSAGVPVYVPEYRKIHGVRVAVLVAGFPESGAVIVETRVTGPPVGMS